MNWWAVGMVAVWVATLSASVLAVIKANSAIDDAEQALARVDSILRQVRRNLPKDSSEEAARATVVRVGKRQVLSVQHQGKRQGTNPPDPDSWLRYGR